MPSKCQTMCFIFVSIFTISGVTIAQDKPVPKFPGELVAYFTFNKEVKPVPGKFRDSGPNDFHASVMPPDDTTVTLDDGTMYEGLYLSGGEASVELPNAAMLNLKPPFTIALWINPHEGGSNTMEIVNKKWDADMCGFRLRYVSNMLSYNFGNGHEEVNLMSAPGALISRRWQHVAVVHDEGKVFLYVNGLVVAAEQSELIPADTVFPIRIGQYVGDKKAYSYRGIMDELVILQGAMTSEDILKIATLTRRKER